MLFAHTQLRMCRPPKKAGVSVLLTQVVAVYSFCCRLLPCRCCLRNWLRHCQLYTELQVSSSI
jgi:hypothetical protein